MKKSKKPSTVVRMYQQADVTVESFPDEDGTPRDPADRTVNIRFRTVEFSDKGRTESVTPWVTFTLPLLENLATQMSALVETAKRWQPGKPAPAIGTEHGVHQRGPFKDS